MIPALEELNAGKMPDICCHFISKSPGSKVVGDLGREVAQAKGDSGSPPHLTLPCAGLSGEVELEMAGGGGGRWVRAGGRKIG